MAERKLFIAWNESKTEGAVFDNWRDAQSAMDGEHWIDPKIGFPCISALAEAFFELMEDDECSVEEVTVQIAEASDDD